MSQTTLNRIVEQLDELDQDQLCELSKLIAEKTEVVEPEAAKASIYQRLVDRGILKRLPRKSTFDWSSIPLVEIEGKPLSDTIIEDRR
ncbi:MAG: hypothetical protein ABJA67_03240 [Chthonomonadales bacterium]